MTDSRCSQAQPCPFHASCHFLRIAEAAPGDQVLRSVYCAGVWNQCSIYTLRAHGHDPSPCLWPDGEVKTVEVAAG